MMPCLRVSQRYNFLLVSPSQLPEVACLGQLSIPWRANLWDKKTWSLPLEDSVCHGYKSPVSDLNKWRFSQRSQPKWRSPSAMTARSFIKLARRGHHSRAFSCESLVATIYDCSTVCNCPTVQPRGSLRHMDN